MAPPEANGQVLATQPEELRIAVLGDDAAKLRKRNFVRQVVEQRPVTRIDAAIEVADGVAEVPRRDVVLVVEKAAAQDVEQDIRVVVDCNVFLGSELECVTAAH